jgi:hypothetical protein
MEKKKLNALLSFLQERSVVPLETKFDAFEDNKRLEVLISKEDVSVKFAFHKNGKVTIRSKFSDKDCVDSKHWVSTLDSIILTTVIKDKKSDDLEKLRATYSHNSNIIRGREEYLRRYPYLKMPNYYKISNSFWLSEDCGIDLLKSYVTGG